MEGALQVTETFVIGADELGWRFSRSSGPGGQGVNTTDSRVELSWAPGSSRALAELPVHLQERLRERIASELVNGSVVIAASEYRAQLRNREAARRRLAQRLREALAPPPPRRRRTRPTRGSVERRLQGKRRTAEVKQNRRRPD